jgi:uncharacterized protein YabN with tetrapyrrole methylase and pyrophosphatase domain
MIKMLGETTMASRKNGRASILKGIPEDLSSLALAYRLTQKASRVGFDWPDLSGVLKKMDEELEEFREALSLKNRRRIAEELGDLLFVLVNVARFLRIDPEKALKKTVIWDADSTSSRPLQQKGNRFINRT